MRENGLTVLETIVKGKKETYQTPSCTIFSLYPESMLAGSVHGETKNERRRTRPLEYRTR